MNRDIVLKIGGSVLYDQILNLNIELLSKLGDWYHTNKDSYKKLVLVVGGGSLSRDLQNRITASVGGEEYLHNIGMSVTQTNASILKGYLSDPEIYLPRKLGDIYEALWEEGNLRIVSGGLKSGWSTDMDSAVFADILNLDKVYKISNIEYIYDKDPKENTDAQPIKDLTWDRYFELFNINENSQHSANGHIPIDVECARFCSNKNISFFVTGGSSISTKETIQDILTDGTLIHP